MRDPRPRKGEEAGSEVSPTTVTPVLVAELLAEGERTPVYVHVIDHPDARVLVDTGMTQLHPAVADMDPRLIPLSAQADFDLASIDVVINTHLHFDHCGGNHLFTGRPIYVQRRELEDARSEDDYTIREWVEAPDVQYVPVDGELELLPGLRLVPAPGHTRGRRVERPPHQVLAYQLVGSPARSRTATSASRIAANAASSKSLAGTGAERLAPAPASVPGPAYAPRGRRPDPPATPAGPAR
jgi:N-acyl homoserine lactone hydrolase